MYNIFYTIVIELKNKKLTSIGGSHGFIVDRAFVKNGQIKKDIEYNLEINLSSKNTSNLGGGVKQKKGDLIAKEKDTNKKL